MNADLTSAPSLPPSLASLYSNMSEREQQVFNKVFRSMHDAVAPVKRFVHGGGVLYGYWIVEQLREEYDLSPVELSLLSYLYHISGCGRQVIDGAKFYLSPSFPCTYNYWVIVSGKFKRRGWIKRSVRNPAKPYTSGFKARGMRYMMLTDTAVNVIKTIETELYRRVRSCSFDDVLCGYGKGQI